MVNSQFFLSQEHAKYLNNLKTNKKTQAIFYCLKQKIVSTRTFSLPITELMYVQVFPYKTVKYNC